MIGKDELEAALRASLEDRRLSKGERYDLKAMLGTTPLDDETRAFVRNRVFDVARELGGEPAAMEVLDWVQDVIKAVESNHRGQTQMEVLVSPGEECLATIQRLLRWCQHSADICVFTITDNRIAEAIAECADRGVRVRVISDNDKSGDTGSDVVRLDKLGIDVRLDRSEHHMHHKFAIFDDAKALTGSYNWTRSAAAYNRENLLICDDPRAVGSFRHEFDRLWGAFG